MRISPGSENEQKLVGYCAGVARGGVQLINLKIATGQFDEFNLSELSERLWARYQCDSVKVPGAERWQIGTEAEG